MIGIALVLLALAAAPPQERDPEEEAAIRLARETLAEELSIDADALEEEGVAVATWPDASLGCPRPGAVYAQVVTQGFRVVLKANGERYDVRVAGSRALVCRRLSKPATGAVLEDVKAAARIHDRARRELAARLGVAETAVAVTLIRPVTWPREGAGCTPLGPAEAPEGVRGFLVTLEHKGRSYLYRAEGDTVLPCPDGDEAKPR